MTRQQIFEAVQEIFQDVFDDEALVITDETNADDIEDWDSLEHITLIVAMEKEFKMKFDIKEVNKLENVGGMIDLIKRKLDEGLFEDYPKIYLWCKYKGVQEGEQVIIHWWW